MKKSSKQLVEMAGSLEELATMICGHGSFAYHNDDRDYPIRKEAVLEYLEMGEGFSKRKAVEKPVNKELDGEIDNYIKDNFFGSETMGFFSNKTKEELNDRDVVEIARHFAAWQRNKDYYSSEELDKVIDEAIEDFYEKDLMAPSMKREFDEVSDVLWVQRNTIIRILRKVVKWQKEKDQKEFELLKEWFEDIAGKCEQLTSGNVSHNGKMIRGYARNCAEYIKSDLL